MDPFQVLAFDPGGSTGWASFNYNKPGQYRFESGTLSTPEHHTSIRWLIQDHCMGGLDNNHQVQPLTVISESFEFRQSPDSAKNARRGLELVSREYIGVMKLITSDLCVPFKQQQPSHRNFITHEKLERLGQLHKPLHENRHRIDALQHLCYYLIVTKRVEELRSAIKRTSTMAS